MVTCVPRIENLEDLRNFVNQTLCDLNNLEPGAFPLTESPLLRGPNPCGMYFCLHGPRAVKFSAIWETDRHTVLFYGANGERTHRTELTPLSRWEPAAA